MSDYLSIIRNLLSNSSTPLPSSLARADFAEPAEPGQPPSPQEEKPATPIGELLAGSDSDVLVAAYLKIGDTEALEATFGPEWEKLAAKTAEIVRQEVQRGLGKADILEETDPNTFVMCFSQDDVKAADAKTRQIIREIKSGLYRHSPELAKQLPLEHFAHAMPANKAPEDFAAVLTALSTEAPTPEERQHLEDTMLLQRTSASYSPFWNPETSRLGMSRVHLGAPVSMRRRVAERKDPQAEAEAAITIQCEALARAATHLAREKHSRDRSEFMISVPFSALAHEHAALRLTTALAEIPETVRGMLVIEISGLPVAPRKLLEAWALPGLKALRSTHCRLVVRIPRPDLQLLGPLIDSLHGVSIRFPARTAPTKQLKTVLEEFSRSAGELDLATFAEESNSLGLAQAVAEARFTWIAGTAIHPPSHEPKPAQSFTGHNFRSSKRVAHRARARA